MTENLGISPRAICIARDMNPCLIVKTKKKKKEAKNLIDITLTRPSPFQKHRSIPLYPNYFSTTPISIPLPLPLSHICQQPEYNPTFPIFQARLHHDPSSYTLIGIRWSLHTLHQEHGPHLHYIFP